jgi:hypothetical protein
MNIIIGVKVLPMCLVNLLPMSLVAQRFSLPWREGVGRLADVGQPYHENHIFMLYGVAVRRHDGFPLLSPQP